MRSTLRSDALASYAGQFVWLELNYDDPRNAAFLTTHLGSAFPVLTIIDPTTEQATGVWTGGGSAPGIASFLDDVLARPRDDADALLGRAEGLLGGGDAAGAVKLYDAAIAAGGAGWSRHDHAIETLVGALQVSDAHTCVTRAAAEAPKLPRAHPFINVVVTGVSCLQGDPPGLTSEDGKRLVSLANEALAMPNASEDDHYQLFEALYAIAAADPAASKAVTARYLAFIDQLPPWRSDDERMARDLALLRATVKAGVPERAIPVLEASERALPDDDNASARLATAYTAARRYADAIAACTRGLARKPGPTATARFLGSRATAEATLGDAAAATRDLASALAAAAQITVRDQREMTQQQLQHQLDALH